MKNMKICAFVCALAVGLSVTGCADTTWALKDGNITIPTGVYNYFLINNASTVSSLASSANAASSGLSAASADMWSQTVSGTGAATWAMNSALDSCKQLAVIEKLCAARKISVTSSQKTEGASTASSNYSRSSGVLSKNGISQASVERIVDDYYYLEPALFTSYYGTNGDKAVPESDIEAYYTKNYVHVKQIFVAKFDTTSSNYTALTGDKLTAAKAKANEAYKKASADIKNFSTYVTKYNEDPGMTSNPDGYIFSKESAASTGYDTKFTDLAFSLKVGQVGMAESDMGWFIEYKAATDPKASSFTAAEKQGVLQYMKSADFQKILKDEVAKDKGVFQQNNNTLNHYDPKKLDLTTTS